MHMTFASKRLLMLQKHFAEADRDMQTELLQLYQQIDTT